MSQNTSSLSDCDVEKIVQNNFTNLLKKKRPGPRSRTLIASDFNTSDINTSVSTTPSNQFTSLNENIDPTSSSTIPNISTPVTPNIEVTKKNGETAENNEDESTNGSTCDGVLVEQNQSIDSLVAEETSLAQSPNYPSTSFSGKDLSKVPMSKRRSLPSTLQNKKKQKLTHDDILQMDDPDYSPEFNEWVKKQPIILPENWFIHVPNDVKKMAGKPPDSLISCEGCNSVFPAIDDGNDGLFPCIEYYKHCIQKCSKYSDKVISCEKCYQKFLDNDEYQRHLRSQCLTFFKKKIAILRLKSPWMNWKLFYDLLERKVQYKNKACCYASELGCKAKFACEMKRNTVFPGLELYVHCVDECKFYKSMGRIRHCEACDFSYLNEDDYKNYDKCEGHDTFIC